MEISFDIGAPGEGAIATADFYLNGRQRTDGADIRVATEEDQPVASRVLTLGPGDRVRVAFAIVPGVRRYYVYFGNPQAPAQPADELKATAGLTMELRELPGGPVENFQQVEQAWAASQKIIGRLMLASPLLGLNPFGEQQRTIARLTGTFRAPEDSRYEFAMGADDRAALYLDSKPILFAAEMPRDTRIHAAVTLNKGPHELTIYQVNLASDLRLSVLWKHDKTGYGPVDADVLGTVYRGTVGPLETLDKPLTGGFTVRYEGECFFANGYAHRYRFIAQPTMGGLSVKCAWDFGDGQTSTNSDAQHVFLADGVYPVKLIVTAGNVTDTQTTRLAVSRDWEHIDKPAEDKPFLQARMVSFYDPERIPPAWLPRAAWLYLRGDQFDSALSVCKLLASMPKHPDPAAAIAVIREVSGELRRRNQPQMAIAVLQRVPADSDLSAGAIQELAELLLWRTGDAAAASKFLAPIAPTGDPRTQRLYAQALVLNGNITEGKKLLEALPAPGDAVHHAALSGAAARTIEYYVRQNEIQAGEEAWDKWNEQYPQDFLGGYSVLLKTYLMEIAKCPQAAARVAEGFALSVPTSSYSPQLLERAARLIAISDPRHSTELRTLLKERYPEQPQ